MLPPLKAEIPATSAPATPVAAVEDRGVRVQKIPLVAKVAGTAFLAVLLPVYWRAYGPTNFLWFCDAALLLTVAGMWLESPLLISMCSVGITAAAMPVARGLRQQSLRNSPAGPDQLHVRQPASALHPRAFALPRLAAVAPHLAPDAAWL